MGEYANGFWYWVAAGSVQTAMGVVAYRRGCGDGLMPFKAFGIASLFVGAGASAIGGLLHASGIHEVEDVKEVGKSLRRRLGFPPRNF
ncbi:hypothetical protein AMTRI_Chr13g83280 [Amborella trichopoda]|uniref:Uncharacterized protein n=1 Tax=Amborella trichopoda TaxID=13333 RepID=W1NSU4_AMBTC|nr:uncharacterized protein LOC18428223 [Amborella trichopoda]ERN00177.1 hypothetical protein AMTR_s00111p00072010 [Amborella trichopoda]|eukprot:XP_006837323.1 uncharacterized protein LOC18428223 [Amborella trichopoda]